MCTEWSTFNIIFHPFYYIISQLSISNVYICTSIDWKSPMPMDDESLFERAKKAFADAKMGLTHRYSNVRKYKLIFWNLNGENARGTRIRRRLWTQLVKWDDGISRSLFVGRLLIGFRYLGNSRPIWPI